MTTNKLLTMVAAATALANASAHAAVINLSDFSATPDGTTKVDFLHTDVNALNGGQVLPTGTPKTVYVITTFTFGTGSDAHLQWQFSTSSTAANRIGVEVQDTGLVQSLGTGNGTITVGSVDYNKRSTFNLNQDLAGQTVTLLTKLDYNADYSVTYNARLNTTASTSDDTLMNVWINPTASAVEGSGPFAGDMYALWNSAGFSYFRTTLQNQSTPGTAGDSFITNTTILTGTDATFSNALALAIPEPSAALLGGLGLLALLRRRRD